MIMDNTLSLAQAVPLQPQQQLPGEKLSKIPGDELDPKAFEAQLSQLAVALAAPQPQPDAVKQSVARMLNQKSDTPIAIEASTSSDGMPASRIYAPMVQLQQAVPSTKADSVIAGPQPISALDQTQSMSKLEVPQASVDLSKIEQMVRDVHVPSQPTLKTHKQLSQVQSEHQSQVDMAQVMPRMGGDQGISIQAVSSPIARVQTKAMQSAKGGMLGSEDYTVNEIDLATPQGVESAPLMISGGEFLSTLQSARKSPVSERSHAVSTDRPDASGILAKPQLKVIPGRDADASVLPLADKPKDLLKLVSKDGEPLFRDQLTAPTVVTTPAQFMARPEHMTPPVEVTGHVVQGAMTRERLSSESLTQIATGIGSFGKLQQGGEMKIRLKPDNLGELHLRVSTSGNQVGLKIQASDDGAKKVLEESIQYLRDSLSSRNLSLGRVEVTVSQPLTALAQQGGTSLADYSSQSQQYQGLRGDLMNDGSGYEQSHRQGRQTEAELEYAPEFARGRLDVRA